MERKFSLLVSEGEAKISARALYDLGFYTVGEAVFAEARSLFKNFLRVLGAPVANMDVLLERQRVYMDFCKNPTLVDEIEKYCCRAQEFYLNPFGKTFRTVHDRLKYYLSNTLALLDLYDEFPRVFSKFRFDSSVLGEYRQKPCGPLKNELERLASLYTDTPFSVNVAFNNGFKLKSASLAGLQPTKKTLASARNRKKREAENAELPEDSISFGGNNMIYNVANELKTSMILNLCQNISSINSAVKDFFANIRAEAAFYEAALMLQRYIEEKGLPLCMPKIDCRAGGGIFAKGVYDLCLSAVLASESIVSNDISMENGKILIVTGHNRGGKTTFLKSVGISQILAQAGLFATAGEYSCPLYNGILTHFPSGEDDSLGDGKLAEELTRLKQDFHVLRGGGLALFNESFTTTTTREGSEIGIDVLRAVCASGSHAVFVTHLMELAESRKLIGSTVSLTTESADSYKIAEGEPLADIYAYDML